MRFFKKVANKMQLSEAWQSGESGSDSDGDGIPFISERPDNLPPAFASEAKLNFGVSGIVDVVGNDLATELTNYPNPFSESTDIYFHLPESADVLIEVFNAEGQALETIIDAPLGAGNHTIQ